MIDDDLYIAKSTEVVIFLQEIHSGEIDSKPHLIYSTTTMSTERARQYKENGLVESVRSTLGAALYAFSLKRGRLYGQTKHYLLFDNDILEKVRESILSADISIPTAKKIISDLKVTNPNISEHAKVRVKLFLNDNKAFLWGPDVPEFSIVAKWLGGKA